MKTIAFIFYLSVLSIMSYPHSKDLLCLSNSCDMVNRTRQVHHCRNRMMERNITARRNAFLKTANVQHCQADSIVIIEYEIGPNSSYAEFHAFCNDSSGTPRFLNHQQVSVIIPPRLNYRKLFMIYKTNMIPDVRDRSGHAPLQELARLAFSTGGDPLRLESRFKVKSNVTGSYDKYYLWLVVREGKEYKTVCYCMFLGELL